MTVVLFQSQPRFYFLPSVSLFGSAHGRRSPIVQHLKSYVQITTYRHRIACRETSLKLSCGVSTSSDWSQRRAKLIRIHTASGPPRPQLDEENSLIRDSDCACPGCFPSKALRFED